MANDFRDVTCEACGRQWRLWPGEDASCPTCYHEPPMISLCGWCPDAAENTRIAHEAGFEVSHGMCDDCQQKFQQEAR